MRRFVAGDDKPELEAEVRARAAVTLDMLGLTFEAIAKFYEPPIPDEPSAPQAWSDPLGEELPASLIDIINEETD